MLPGCEFKTALSFLLPSVSPSVKCMSQRCAMPLGLSMEPSSEQEPPSPWNSGTQLGGVQALLGSSPSTLMWGKNLNCFAHSKVGC